MGRVHAPELEDYAWFPATLRDAMTDFLRVSAEALGLFDVIVPLLGETIRATGARRVVDLCSGGGGPIMHLTEKLASEHGLDVPVVLTDKFPNAGAFDAAEARRGGRVTSRRDSIDATAVPPELDGVRTLFNALHHFPPPLARAILADAVKRNQPIAVFEIVERTPTGWLAMVGVPLTVLALTPFVRPARLASLGLTYALPIVPLTTWWDGIASTLRAYSIDELHALVAGLEHEGYGFRVERVRSGRVPVHVTALIGTPVAAP